MDTAVCLYRIYHKRTGEYVRPSRSNRSFWETRAPATCLVNALNEELGFEGYEVHYFEATRVRP